MRNILILSAVAMMSILGTSAFAQNSAPTISVSAGAASIANDSVVAVNPFDTLAGLNLSITVSDADNDNCSLDLAVTNVSTQGLVASEWTQAGAASTPFVKAPVSGSFNVADIEHTIVLTASDGSLTTNFSLFVVVEATTGNSGPKLVLQSFGTPLAPFSVIPVGHNATVSQLGLTATAIDADSTDNLDISIAVSNFTSQGLVPSEWTATSANSGAQLSPTSGQFNVQDVPHVVSLTIDDGESSATYNYILLIGPDGSTSTNAAPFIGLFAGDTYLSDGSSTLIPFNTLISALSLSLIVADFEGDNTSTTLNGVTNFTTQGLVLAEWTSTAISTSYTLSPTSGQFNVPGIDHTVTLTADDGNASQYGFTLAIGQRPASGSGDDDDSSCTVSNSRGASWLLLIGVLLLSLRAIQFSRN
ncbi:MAG: hypothetical protein ACYTDT_02350 [Planctomycetota bacterium]|jgi:hypothetical protein